MSLPNRSTKLKVAFGYILLTALLFISIGYIYQEMKSACSFSIASRSCHPSFRASLWDVFLLPLFCRKHKKTSICFLETAKYSPQENADGWKRQSWRILPLLMAQSA